MAINDNRIIDIEGVSFLVNDSTYDYYWSTKQISKISESHIIACRRILELGPNDTKIDYNKLSHKIHSDIKDKERLFSLLAESDTVTFIEPDYLRGISNGKIIGAMKTIEAEKELDTNNPYYDLEFEPDLEL